MLMVILVCNVKRKIQIVINNFAQVKPCAEMNLELEITLVSIVKNKGHKTFTMNVLI